MNKQMGFSLPELLITISIVAILAAIAIPSYQKYVREARLYDAKRAIIANVAALERYYGQHYQFKKNSTTWPDLPITETESSFFNFKTKHFCIKFQGNPRGVKGDRFTLKAVAFDKKNETRSIIMNDDQQMQVCQNSTSHCNEKNFFAASGRVDNNCVFI